MPLPMLTFLPVLKRLVKGNFDRRKAWVGENLPAGRAESRPRRERRADERTAPPRVGLAARPRGDDSDRYDLVRPDGNFERVA